MVAVDIIRVSIRIFIREIMDWVKVLWFSDHWWIYRDSGGLVLMAAVKVGQEVRSGMSGWWLQEGSTWAWAVQLQKDSKAVPGLLSQWDGSGVGAAWSGETYLCEGQEKERKVFEKERGARQRVWEKLHGSVCILTVKVILGRLFA